MKASEVIVKKTALEGKRKLTDQGALNALIEGWMSTKSVRYTIEVGGVVSLTRRGYGKVVRWCGQPVSVYYCEVGSGEVGLHYQGVFNTNQVGVFFEPDEGIYTEAGSKQAMLPDKKSKIDAWVTFSDDISFSDVRNQILPLFNEELLELKDVAESPVRKAGTCSISFLPTQTLVKVLTDLAGLDASSGDEWEKKLLKDLGSADSTREIVKGIKLNWVGFGSASERDRYQIATKPEGEVIPSSELIRRLFVKGRSGGSLTVRT
jgi:hypothetical protein